MPTERGTRDLPDEAAGDPSDDALTEDAPPLLAGRYRLEGLIGAGGMGTVYRARDLELDEVVALKLLSQLEASAVASFRDEVKLARRVTHRNVARTFDIGEHEGARFLTMEYVRGETLSRLLAHGRLPPARAGELAAQIAAGLGAIHAEGLAHGDLKPGNILVDAAGQAKLSDFGLARVSEPASAAAAPGTPEYMAPEQLSGALANARSDVFALGIVLFELFAGRRPWTGTMTEMMGKKLLGAAPEAPTRAPPAIDALILRCLAFDPSSRPADATEIASVLLRESSPASSSTLPPVARPTQPEGGATRVAVRALLAESCTDAYLGLALASDIARMLATAPELEVLGAPLPASDDTPERVGRTVSAKAVVEGNVRRSGASLRIGLRLVSVDDGFLLWGRSVTVELPEVLTELTSASRAIAEALSAKPAQHRSMLALKDPQILDLYLRARKGDGDFWHDADSDFSDLYGQLLELAPGEPLLLASYATSIIVTAFRRPGALELARDAAERALRAAPDLADASFALGLVLFVGNELEGAARAIVRALQLSPSLPGGHGVLGQMLIEVGRPNDGLARLELSLRLDPRLTIAWSNAVRVLSFDVHDPGPCDELLARAPVGRSPTNEWLYWVTRARIAMVRGGEMVGTTVDELRASPFSNIPSLAAVIRALTREATMAEVKNVLESSFGHDGAGARARTISLTIATEIAMYLGDTETAMECIALAEANGLVDLFWLDMCPLLAPLRARGAFVDVREHTRARAMRVVDALNAAGLARG